MNYRTLVILAKSYKRTGYCVAGRELLSNGENPVLGNWIRLVSRDINSNRAIFPVHMQIRGCAEINVLDIVQIPFEKELPEPGQPENCLISLSQKWRLVDRMKSIPFEALVEKPMDLWFQPHYRSDVFPAVLDSFEMVKQSLYIIKPEHLRFRLSNDIDIYNGKYKRRIHAIFDYMDHSYCLSVTDPKIKRLVSGQYPAQGLPAKEIVFKDGDEYLLCVSLGPRFGYNQHHYKLVATIFDLHGQIQEFNC